MTDHLPPRPWLALSGTLLVQTLASLAMTAASVLAPAVAPTLGLAPERVGLFASAAYLAAMLVGLRSGLWAQSLGAVRLSQFGLLACGLGALLATAGVVPALLGAALVIGAGYGVVNPAAASLLSRHAPVSARGLFFSIKQTGVPLGVALSGLLMPAGLALLGWRWTAAGVALASLVAALALVPAGRRLDPARSGATGAPFSDAATTPVEATRPMATVWRDAALRRLSLCSLVFAMTQQCFVTFVVSWMVLALGWPLAQAASVLAASQLTAALSRVAMGHAADRWIAPARLLGLLGLAMALACLGLALQPAGGPAVWVVVATLLCSATAVGWNGVFFAELARLTPARSMAGISGATQVFTFGGGLLGPLLFGEFARAGGGYSLGYGLLAAGPALMGLVMLRSARRADTAAR